MSRRSPHGSVWILAALLGVVGCDSGLVSLQVELKTDYVPGVEFYAVELDVESTTVESTPAAQPDVDYQTGRSVGEVADLMPSSARLVEVRLLDAEGALVAKRRALVEHLNDLSVRLLVTRGCGGVECPDEGQTCVAGSCVGVECLTGDEPECGEPECTAAADCTSDDGCSSAQCDEGSCLFVQSEGACEATEFCAIGDGCSTRPATCEGGCDDGNPCSDDHCIFTGCRFAANGSCPSPCETQTEISAPECAALEELYWATGGPNWSAPTDWLLTETPCSWNGVTCAGGHVTELNLVDNGMEGTIPPGIEALAWLLRLDLSVNRLSGPVPPTLGNIGTLEVLRIRENQLTGNVPTELAALTELRELNLYANELEGPIPVELTSYAFMRIYNLRDNNLTGTIPPELGNMTTLIELQISSNQLDGTIPPELGALTEMQRLHLHTNNLTGPIPRELTAMTQMTEVWWDRNGLSGEIPAGFETWMDVTRFELVPNGCFTAETADLGVWLDANAGDWTSGCTP